MPPQKRSSNLIRNLLIFLAAVIPVAVLLGPKYTYQRYLNDSLEEMDDYGKQVWEDMHEVPIDIPSEWLVAPEYPEDLLDLVEESKEFLRFQNWEYLDSSLYEKLENGQELTEEEKDTVRNFLRTQDPRIQSVSEIVGHPDYRFGVDGFGTIDCDQSLNPFSLALATRVRWAIQNEKWVEAIDDVCLLFCATRRLPLEISINFLYVLPTLERGCELVEDLSLACSEPRSLSILLEHLTENYSWLRMSEPDNPVNFLAYRDLKLYEEIGIPVEIEPGMTLIDSRFSIMDRANQEELRTSPSFYSLWQGIVVYPTQKFWGVFEVFYCSMLPSELEVLEQMRKVNAQLDLARLNLANRIRELEGRPLAIKPSALVPEFIEEEPLDPFSGKSFLWDDEEKEFYSERVREIEAELEEMRKVSKRMMESGYGGGMPFGSIPYGAVSDATESCGDD